MDCRGPQACERHKYEYLCFYPVSALWETLRGRIQQYGMRNSNCLANAPTATIANIVDVSASIEPTYQNLYVKSNLSGDFTNVPAFFMAQLLGAFVGAVLAWLHFLPHWKETEDPGH